MTLSNPLIEMVDDVAQQYDVTTAEGQEINAEVAYYLDRIAHLMQSYKVEVIKALKEHGELSLKQAYDLHIVLDRRYKERRVESLRQELEGLAKTMDANMLSTLLDKAYEVTDFG